MSDFRKTVRTARSAKTSPAFRRFASRATLGAAAVGGALLMLLAVILGEHAATRAIREHERLIGHDLVASVDSVLSSASARSRANGLCRSKRWTVEFRRYKVADERIDE